MSVKHIAHLGITGSGKTYRAFEEIVGSSRPCIYYNVKHQQIEVLAPQLVKQLTATNTLPQLEHAIKHYKMVDFRAAENSRDQAYEIAVLVTYCMKHKDITLAIDEAWEVIPQHKSDSPIYKIARRGRSEDVQLLLMSQSGADIDKKALKQCDIIRIFRHSEWDYKYLRNIGFDGEKIRAQLESAPAYSYVELTGGVTKLVTPEKEREKA